MSSIVVVTITKIQSGATATPTAHSTTSSHTSTSTATSSHSDLSSGAVAGIVVGSIVAGILFVILVFYLLRRYSRRRPARASNPAYDRDPTPGGPDQSLELPRTRPLRFNRSSRHPLRPSFSSEPLLSSDRLSRSTLTPSTPGVQTPSTSRLDSVPLDVGDSPFSPWDLSYPVRSDSASHLERSVTPPVLDEDKAPLKPQQTMFVHRMLQSRARASEAFPLEHRSSIPSRSATSSTSTAQPDEEQLLADAELAALRDAGMERAEDGSELYEGSVDDTESLYSQLSADLDHVIYFSDGVARRKSSRRRPRTPAPAELPPVPELPDIARVPIGQPVSRPVSAVANSSRHEQVPQGTASPPVEPLPLLASANFGKTSTASGTPPGSMSSNTGWGSNSSGTASRYPSLAASSMGTSLRPGPRSDDGTTDWHHPPTGLAGLKTLQIGQLHNPHSPVDEHPEVPLAADPPAPVKRAHLREGTTSSMPEVEKRRVTQGGIAHIDVSL